jgi:hypothetical protein
MLFNCFSHPLPLKKGDKEVVLVLALVQLYLHITLLLSQGSPLLKQAHTLTPL